MSISRINSIINNARTKRLVKTKAFATKQTRVSARATGTNSARSSAVTKNSNSNSLLNILRGMTGDTTMTGEKIAKNQAQSYEYETMRLAAARVGEHMDRLTDIGDQALFAQGEEGREGVEKEISTFVNNYNIMVRKLNASGEEADEKLAEKLSDEISAHAATLKQFGITQDGSGVLSLDQRTLRQSDYEELKKVFHSSTGLPKKIKTLAESVESAAREGLDRLKKENYTLSTTYSRYGTSDSSYGWTGSRYSSKG